MGEGAGEVLGGSEGSGCGQLSVELPRTDLFIYLSTITMVPNPQPARFPANEFPSQLASQPANFLASQLPGQLVSQPASFPDSQPVYQNDITTNRGWGWLVSWLIGRSAGRPGGRSAGRPVDRSAGKVQKSQTHQIRNIRTPKLYPCCNNNDYHYYNVQECQAPTHNCFSRFGVPIWEDWAPILRLWGSNFEILRAFTRCCSSNPL